MKTIKKTKSFGEHLRDLREAAGLTLKFVAEQSFILSFSLLQGFQIITRSGYF